MDKSQRNYEFIVEGDAGDTLIIKPPFTLEFSVDRRDIISANSCSVRIYNLGKDNRRRLQKDQGDLSVKGKLMTLRAGYGKNISTIFRGNITRAYSVREGNNYVTSIECSSGFNAYVASYFSKAYPKGTLIQTIIEDMIATLRVQGIERGKIGNFPGKLLLGSTFSGGTIDLIKQQIGDRFFIDNGFAYAINEGETISDRVFHINAKSGLLGTPVREFQQIKFDMLFEPQIFVGQLVSLESRTEDRYNATYRVLALTHKGTISEAVGGDATTSITVLTQKLQGLV